MKLLAPHETAVIGHHVRKFFGPVVADKNCLRVEWLVSNVLTHIKPADWAALYLDPNDGRLWEKRYLEGERHGGGPVSLFLMSEEEARRKYGYPGPPLPT